MRLPSRRRRHALRLLFGLIPLLCLPVIAALFETSASYADSPAQQGWWTVTSPSGIPAGLPVSHPTNPPDVPADGLLVQGGPTAASPDAYAAIVYPLSANPSLGPLTLTVAANSGTTPNSTLRLCPLTAPTLNSEQGGPMSDAPAYNCSRSATAKPSAGKTSYQFTVSSLVSDGVLAVAILPSSVGDRVVISQPGSNSLATHESPGSQPSPTPAGSGSSANPSDTSSSGGVAPGSATAPGILSPSASAAAVQPATLAGSAAGPSTAAGPTLGRLSTPVSNTAAARPSAGLSPDGQATGQGIASAFPASASSSKGGAEPIPAALAAAGLLLALTMWVAAGRAAGRRSHHALAGQPGAGVATLHDPLQGHSVGAGGERP